jgi:hypothetical protein
MLVPTSDLELYTLDQLKLLAVMTGPKRLRAMVLAPNGKTYLVWENMKIGMRKGVVRRITPDAVHVREQVVNVLGQEENVDSDIRMKLDENGTSPTQASSIGALGAALSSSTAKPAVPGASAIDLGLSNPPAAVPTPTVSSVPVPASAPADGASQAPGPPPAVTAAPLNPTSSGGGG